MCMRWTWTDICRNPLCHHCISTTTRPKLAVVRQRQQAIHQRLAFLARHRSHAVRMYSLSSAETEIRWPDRLMSSWSFVVWLYLKVLNMTLAYESLRERT